MGTNLADFDNEWYKPGSFTRRFCWYITSIIFFKNALFPFYRFKLFLLRLFGAKVGKNIIIKPCVNIKYPWFLELGNHVWIGENVWIDNLGKVRIGNNVCLSQGCFLLTGNHDYNDHAFKLIVNGIDLEDGVWIGARATVCGGSICRDHSVLSVGSVAVGELESMGIYTGNPAIKIKDRNFRKTE
jgi:putative colanic acid biosynthesis acetyltransferase WcaF